jgi:hypothetical protein
VIPLGPRAVDQDLLGVGQVELFTDHRLRSEGDSRSWVSGTMARLLRFARRSQAQFCLALGPEDRHECRGFTTHNWDNSWL